MKKPISNILIAVFVLVSLALGFQTIKRNSSPHKKPRTLQINSEIFSKKIGPESPEWMLKQIREDLSFYQEKGISKEMLDEVFQGNHIECLSLVRFTIKDGHITISCSETQFEHKRLISLLRAFRELNKLVNLPDADFIVSLEDSLNNHPKISGVPYFVFAKQTTDNDLIMMPDSICLGGYGKLRNLVKKGNRKFGWEAKKNKVFWRGSTTGGYYTASSWNTFARSKIVLLSLDNPEDIDARFNYAAPCQCASEVSDLLKAQGMISKTVKEIDHLSYKYLIDIDGNSCTYERCFWQLLSNSLLIKQVTPNIQWYYGALKPYEHYIPVKEDLSDLVEKINWARTHDAEAKAIADQGTEFIKNNVSDEDVLAYLYLLIREYSNTIRKK